MVLEEFRKTDLTWDKATRRIYDVVRVASSDENGRKLVVQVLNDGQVEDLSGTSLHLYWKTANEKNKGLDAFEKVDASKGIFQIYFTTEMASNVGILMAHLHLVDDQGTVTSEPFKISVFEGVDNDAVESSDSFSSLTKILIEARNLEENYAPKLTEVTAQLAQTVEKPLGLNHRNTALFDTDFEREGMISFVSDDGNIEDITHFKPLFDQYGYKFTMAIQPDYVGGIDTNGNRVMTWEQIRQLYNEGHTVASHTLSHPHLDELSYEENEIELRESRDILLNKGFDVRHIMYPYGDYNDYTRTLTEKYYLSGATVIATFNSTNTSRSIINRYSILDPARTVEDLKAAVDTAIENKYWLVFYMHGYEMRDNNFVNKLKGLLEHIKEKNAPVVTYDDGYDFFIRKKPITEIPTAKVGSYHMTTSQSIDNSVPHVTVDMPNFNSQRTNTDNFYFFNREKNRIEFPKAGTYLIEYGLLLNLEKDAQAFIQIMFGAETAGTTLLSRELHQNFYVSQAYLDKENNNQRPYPVSGSAVVSFTQGTYDKFFISLPVRIKGQTMTKQNKISAWGESTHITITRLV